MRVLPLVLVPLALVAAACPPAEGDDDDTPPPALVSLGGVTIFQGVNNHTVSARFGEAAPNTACTSEELGGCTLLTCDGANDPVAQTSLDAGAILVKTAERAITLARGDDDLYDTLSVVDEEFFLNAEEVRAELAGGADVDAVELGLVAPTRIQLTAPPLQAVNVKVTNPIEIAWSNSSAGDVEVALSDVSFTRFATCKAPASGGALTIPAEVVGEFPIGSGGLEVRVANAVTSNVDDTHFISFTAMSTVTSPTGGLGSYNVFFEAP